VRADPVRLRQVVWNLLSNALRNTPAGGSISLVTANLAPGWVTITLRDTGRGIAPRMLSRIFTFFEQDEEARRRGIGLGLGLPISKAIVESHGGRIRAESGGLGKGATFIIELRTTSAAPARGAPGPRGAAAARRVPILLVEDNADSAAAIAEFLRLHGHEVKVAGTMQEALARYAPGDLLISDIGLPDGSGHQLLRQLGRERPVVAIALSGYGTPEDLSRSAEAGFARHIVKPVSPGELLALIGELTRD
jgi:CheY-like chemotaxis protein